MRGLRLVLIGSILGLALPSVAAEQVFTVDYDDARLYVPVRAGTRDLGAWVLDTGVQRSIVDDGLAAALGLRPGGSEEVSGAGRGTMRRAEAGPLAVEVGGVPLRLATVSVAPFDALLSPFLGRRVPGLVGSELFAGHRVEIDFASRKIRVDPTSPLGGPGTVEVPLRMEGGIPFASVRLVLPDGRKVQARALVDLGAKATALFTESFLGRGMRAAWTRTVRGSLGAGVGGETRYDFGRMPRIELPGRSGSVVLEDALVGLSAEGTLRGPWGDLLLGSAFLEHWTVLLDLPHHRMVLSGPARVRDVREHDMSGLFLLAEGADLRTVRVHRVTPGSPADDAGLKAGGRVVAVDGRAVEAWTLTELRERLRRRPDDVVALSIEQEGRTSPFQLRLRRLVE
jgi:hypothetical protein